MDDVQQVAGTISSALQTIAGEFTSVRLLIQLGLILLAAIIGTLAATLIRRRIDLTAPTLPVKGRMKKEATPLSLTLKIRPCGRAP